MDNNQLGPEPQRGPSENLRALSPVELALGAVLGDLALGLQLFGWLINIGAAIQWLSVIPFAILAQKTRRRVVGLSIASVSSIAFLIGGLTLMLEVYLAGAIGMGIANALNKKRGIFHAIFRGLAFGGLPVLAIADGLLYLFSNARKVALNQAFAVWSGFAKFLHALGALFSFISKHLHSAASGSWTKTGAGQILGDILGALAGIFSGLKDAFFAGSAFLGHPAKWVVVHWYIVFPALNIIGVLVLILFTYAVSRPIMARLNTELKSELRPASYLDFYDDSFGEPSPVPVEFSHVYFRYQEDGNWILSDLNLEILPGELIAVSGINGSGKSTLGKLALGMKPTKGSVIRSGSVGLGKKGGSAVIFQRPESQVLGARVIDDLVWGLDEMNIESAINYLEMVGLYELREKDTSSLSGGELQRLALASALIRQPSLIVSDESTAMLDVNGRLKGMQALRYAASSGTSVVHITHIESEIADADRVIKLGSYADDEIADSELFVGSLTQRALSKPVVELNRLGHVYMYKTPWEKRALKDVTLTLNSYEAVLFVGPNGSGKSTLAWILTALIQPFEGTVTYYKENGDVIEDPYEIIEDVSMVFQHPRLQLVRPLVKENFSSNFEKISDPIIEKYLDFVNLTPEIFMDKKVSELSGGQLRRVALAVGLAKGARLIVLDEPLSGLDNPSKKSVLRALMLAKKRGVAIAIVSHDEIELPNFIDRVIHLENGTIVKEQSVEKGEAAKV
jgi:energy-coupling factor transporter ATP-binding protein EcfA2